MPEVPNLWLEVQLLHRRRKMSNQNDMIISYLSSNKLIIFNIFVINQWFHQYFNHLQLPIQESLCAAMASNNRIYNGNNLLDILHQFPLLKVALSKYKISLHYNLQLQCTWEKKRNKMILTTLSIGEY